MALSLYNTLTRRKEPFTPLEPGTVKLYCCGVTVYDYCHLGHARSYIAWDTARRYLLWQGYQVQYVQNFTDIDDKILNRARQEQCSMETISQRYTQAYFEDMARLNILEADAYTYATQTLDGIKRLIAELEQKGFAYATGGDVYYAVRKFDGYGKLSGRKLDDMQAGASGRVPASATQSTLDGPQKQDPFDFALWKAAKPEEPAWESPWGPGRPGWHIECSAMVQEQFGPTIDIHMGGADLVFPHHENEIAQSEAASGHPLAHYWLHNGMVNVGGEKMSKSLGNFTTIRALLDDAPGAPSPMALRLFVLQAQYRKPIDFTDGAISSAKNGWATLQEGLRFGFEHGEQLGWSEAALPEASTLDRHSPAVQPAVQQFEAAMDDDLNTSGALAVLFELAKELRRVGNVITHQGRVDGDAADLHQQWQTLVVLAQVLGLEAEPEAVSTDVDTLSDGAIEDLLAQRQAARQAKDFAEGDRLRDLLQSQGITLIDKPGGVTDWHR
ncbi:MAG: cysteine--tRNA ligase [Cyanobacteria bacterium]|nr:cysteine--tRNA ligase [Cyanobacteriota bacterium]